MFFMLAVCDVFVSSRHFEKAFCQAREADIQDYAPVQNVITAIFLHISYYYYCGKTDVSTDGLFVVILANLESANVLMLANYIMFYKK